MSVGKKITNELRNPLAAPLVTVFGAGPAGLTAAHELIERGFKVQVVEPRQSLFAEYGCEVGGLAASQYSRVRCRMRMHPYFYDKEEIHYEEWDLWDRAPKKLQRTDAPTVEWVSIMERGEAFRNSAQLEYNREIIQRLHRALMMPVQKIYPFTETLMVQYGKVLPEAEDHLGNANAAKLDSISTQLVAAIATYYQDLKRDLDKIDAHLTQDLKSMLDADRDSRFNHSGKHLVHALHPEVRLRETLLLEVQGCYSSGTRQDAWAEASTTKQQIVSKIEAVFVEFSRKPPTGDAVEAAKARIKAEFYFVRNSLEDVVLANLATLKEIGFFQDNIPPNEIPELQVDQKIANYMVLQVSQTLERRKQKRQGGSAQRVRFNVVEHVVPGEHGYRYFPSFYKHLFDTMKRTPIESSSGKDTRETTYNNLVTPPPTPIAFKSRSDEQANWIELPRRQPESLEEMQQWIKKTTLAFGGDYRDSIRFTNRLLKFMTSCQQRRKLYEDMSWLEFIDGGDESDKPAPAAAAERKTRYSKKAEAIFRTMPQALVGMKAVECDARTYGAASVQNVKDFMSTGEDNDRLLNAPTSVAWLRPWKRYLKSQGVKFFVGHVAGLKQVCAQCLDEHPGPATALDPCPGHGPGHGGEKELIPIVHGPYDPVGKGAAVATGEKTYGQPRPERQRTTFLQGRDVDFYVLALPLERLANIICDQSQEVDQFDLDSDLFSLKKFVTANWGGDTTDGQHDAESIKRDRSTGQPLPRFSQPLRDFTGIQYFFDKYVRMGAGHVYYPDAKWGITSIAQAYMWQQRPSASLGYLGELSVDIGAMYTQYEPVEGQGKMAWNSTETEFAIYSWSQMRETLTDDLKDQVPHPHFYHIDQALEFSDDGIVLNRTPFLVTLPGQFRQRPGTYSKADKSSDYWLQGAFSYVTELTNDDYETIKFGVSHNRWVLAGSFMPTYTRLNTMEAANETGRHAVNAILRALHQDRDASNNTASADSIQPKYAGSGEPMGMPVDVRMMERDELPDLDYLKRIDRDLMQQGLPHVLDILETMEAIDDLPEVPTEMSKAEKIAAVVKSSIRVKDDAASMPAKSALRIAEKSIKQYSNLAKEVGSWLDLVDKR
ncbi:MAG: hypothetical protein KUG79_15140 [Pseudomonadales bacterium]|nr:hypothetical protein [Pseudomonadales bacterium]